MVGTKVYRTAFSGILSSGELLHSDWFSPNRHRSLVITIKLTRPKKQCKTFIKRKRWCVEHPVLMTQVLQLWQLRRPFFEEGISPYLFLLCSQLLADSIKQSTSRGITVANNIITISQLADDTTLFFKDAEEIPKAINIISIFSKASGLHLNMNKCELLSLKQCDLPSICGIPKSHI